MNSTQFSRTTVVVAAAVLLAAGAAGGSWWARRSQAGPDAAAPATAGDAAAPQTETVTLRKVGTVVQAIRAGETGAAVVSTADFDRALGLFKELTSAK